MNVDSEVSERLRHIISCPHDVTNVKTWSNLHTYTCCVVGRRSIKVIGTQTHVADRVISLLVLLPVVSGYGGHAVRFLFQPRGNYVETQRLVFTILSG